MIRLRNRYIAGALASQRLFLARNISAIPLSGPLAKYKTLIDSGIISEDQQQLKTLQKFQDLHENLLHYDPNAALFSSKPKQKENDTGFWGSLFGSSEAKVEIASKPIAIPKGIYLYGGVGCG